MRHPIPFTHKGYGFLEVNAQGTFHPGYDYNYQSQGKDDLGLPFFPYLPGTVYHVQEQNTGYGNMVVVKHKNGKYSKYAHASKILVRVGQKVDERTMLGEVGSTGASSSPHLHFEICSEEVISYGVNFYPNGMSRRFIENNYDDPMGIVETDEHKIKVLFLSPRKYDTELIKENYEHMGVVLKIDYVRFRKKAEWEESIHGGKVAEEWWTREIAPLASGYDMVILVCDEFGKEGAIGYADALQHLGIWRGFVHNTGKPRRFGKSRWNGKKQVEGTTTHEIAHLLYAGTGFSYAKGTDPLHDYDIKGKNHEMRWDLTKFIGWKPRGYTRMFKPEEYYDYVHEDGKLKVKKLKKNKVYMRLVPDRLVYVLRPFFTLNIPKL